MIGNATATDLLRILVLLAGAGTVALAAVVVIIYARGYLVSRRGPKVPWIGLLPAHVALIGASYLLMVGATMAEVVYRIHEPATWRLPVYGAAYVIGAVALWIILGHSRHRYRSITEALG